METMNISPPDQALQELSEVRRIDVRRSTLKAPVSVIVPVKNEAENLSLLPTCTRMGGRGFRDRQPEYR